MLLITIDAYAWNRFNPNHQVSLSALANPKDKTVVTNVSDTEDDESEEEQAEEETYSNDDSLSEEGFTYSRQWCTPMPAISTDATDAGVSDAGALDTDRLNPRSITYLQCNPQRLLIEEHQPLPDLHICGAQLQYQKANAKYETLKLDADCLC